MGKRGPKPKSSFMRELEGSRRQGNPNEPKCEMPALKPAFVAADDVASIEWDRAVAAMPAGVYTALDVPMLTTYALSWSLIQRAQQDINANGAVIVTAKGLTQSPAVKVWKQAADALFKCADRLGLHPGARVALRIPERNPTASKFTGLLGRNPALDVN